MRALKGQNEEVFLIYRKKGDSLLQLFRLFVKWSYDIFQRTDHIQRVLDEWFNLSFLRLRGDNYEQEKVLYYR